MAGATAVYTDVRDEIFASLSERSFKAQIIAEHAGVIAGMSRLALKLSADGIYAELMVADGTAINAGDRLAILHGSAKQIACAEEYAIGFLAKPSGIATAAHRAVCEAGESMRIVCGAWKKMPSEVKSIVRDAVTCGQAFFRICDQPFLYLDKNFVRMFGGVAQTLKAVESIKDKKKAIQVKGDQAAVVEQALTAARSGADIIMVDTGDLAAFLQVQERLLKAGLRERLQLAFAQGIQLNDIAGLRGQGIDILDIGVAILDAPLLDMRLEVYE